MKLKQLLIPAALFISVLVLLVTGCAKDRGAGSKIVIKGSTTVLPITQKAVEAYTKINKSVSISVSGGGSGNGIKALIDGSTDIANSSREIKEKEVELAKSKGIETREITIAYDMIVPVVHPSNPVKNLTLNQLKGIYDGSITNWKQLGGNDSKIVVISRDTSSGTYEVWHESVMKMLDVRKDALLQASNGAIISAVSQNPKALGYVGYGYINESVKAIEVDGAVPTIENGKSGLFPISRKLYIYIDNKKTSQKTLDFVSFLTGPEGQKLVKEAGFIPL